MAFKAAFIGIDRHKVQSIGELTGASRDARALHALFNDTFKDLQSRLLIDRDATLTAITGAIDDALGTATIDDVVVLSFSGHGTSDHALVAYDTDTASLPTSTLKMSELAVKFQASKARAVLCILDCCFSGAAPARVLDGVPAPRTILTDYSAFKGKGRFLIAAASPSQPAWEEPGSGHGLLTRSIIHVFTAGSGALDVTAAVAEVIKLTREAARHLGRDQEPCFVGGVEGGLELPVLSRGPMWATLSPPSGPIHVSRALPDLAAAGFPAEIIESWQRRFAEGLNGLQLDAVNRHHVLDGKSLFVVAPTSSGKTFIGEMAAIKAALGGRKAVFLLPYRALVNEKYEDFQATYAPHGLRIIRCAGDFTDETGLFIGGRYDLAVLTYEMFLSLGVATPHVLTRLGLVVVDEAQFITAPSRGIVVELILTLLLAAKERGLHPQIVTLSAVVGDVNGFDQWLGCELMVSNRRPVPLTEGVLDRSGIYQALDGEGHETETQLVPRHAIHQRKDKPSAQDVIVPLVRELVKAKEKILIFRNRRGPAEGAAGYLAMELGLPPAAAALKALGKHDLSRSAERLRACLNSGTAFHNSNLMREERMAVERFFRQPDGGIEALAATTTLAAGINTPASTVILAEQEFKGEDGRPFTVAEYKNMAGRAGRLGFNETGKAIIYAETPVQRRQLFAKYVRGTPEPIRSSFVDKDFRTWIIRLLSQVRAIGVRAVPHLLASTYAGFLAERDDPNWRTKTEAKIAETVQRFIELGLLEQQGTEVQLSLLGRACGQSTLGFESAMRLIEVVKSMAAEDVTPRNLVGLLQALPEADASYTPVRKSGRTETQRISDAAARFGHAVVAVLRRWVGGESEVWARCKRAAILMDWMRGDPIRQIEERYSVPFGGDIQLGDIQTFANTTRFHLRSARQILAALIVMGPAQEKEFDAVLEELEFGVPHASAELLKSPLRLTRGECLTAIDQGLRTAADLQSAPPSLLQELFGAERAEWIAATLGSAQNAAA